MIQGESQAETMLEPGGTVIRIPVRFRRRSGRKEILLPPGHASTPEMTDSSDPLALAVARAHFWQRWIEDGRFNSVSALARTMRMDEAYARRILKLNSLAPDIVKSILGRQISADVSLSLLLRMPLAWQAQGRALGMKSGGWLNVQ